MQQTGEGAEMAGTLEMPRIVSMDDHLIEPPHLWQSRLPAKYKDQGPRVIVAPRGSFELDGANYVEKPGSGPEMAAWWHYEDHLYQLKLTIACPGMAPEEVEPIGVTFDDIAPGCLLGLGCDCIFQIHDHNIHRQFASFVQCARV